jgi:hypothetical protein
MNEEKKHSMKRWHKWAIASGIFILFIVGARLALKSDWFFDKVRDVAIEQVNKHVNGTIDIESIRGDLLSGFAITGVNLKDLNQDDVIFIDTISVNYSLFSLIRSPYTVDEMNIKGVEAHIVQDEDSVWNVMKLVDFEDAPEEELDPVFWSVKQISLDRFNVNVISDILLPDGSLTVNDLNADLTAGAEQNGFYGSVRSLNFALKEARLPEPIDVFLAGGAEQERYTLESLVINTGRTMLNANAYYEEDEEVQADAEMTPISWRDIAAYVKDLPLQQDIRMELGVSGRLTDLKISVRASSTGMEELLATARLGIGNEVELNSFELNIRSIDLPLLTGLEDTPKIEQILFDGSGKLYADRLPESDWSGSFTVNGFDLAQYAFDSFELTYNLEQVRLDFDGVAAYRDQAMTFRAAAMNIWDELPQWNADIASEHLNLATWLNNPELDSDLNIRGEAAGSGFDPDQLTVQTDFRISNSRFGDQPFTELAFTGDLDPRQITGQLSSILQESELITDFNVNDWKSNPNYRFEMALKKFNTAEITGLEQFPTYLNGTLKGEGSSFDPELITLNATAEFDSSFVNREEIETLRADFRIESSTLFIEDALLESPIADASFTVRQHIMELTEAGNTLSFNAVLKDIQALAPLFGFERFEASGDIRGSLARGHTGYLQFDGSMDLGDVVVDTQFMSDRIIGNITAYLFDEIEVDVDIELIEPYVNGIGVQDVTINTYATLGADATFGSVGFRIVNVEESSISHRGNFSVDSTLVRLHTEFFDITTGLRTLTLIEPFDITYSDDVLRVDTLKIVSPDENAFLTLWAPHVDSLKQHVGLDAANLNLGALQSAIINEAIFEGLLSGRVELYNEPERLEVSATGLLAELKYESGEMDSVRFYIHLADEWLDGHMEAWHNASELIRADIRVPYLPGDPLTFDDQFFDREIEGRVDLFSTELKYWLSFLPDDGFEETEGNISFQAELSGLAGEPELVGRFALRSGLFSGISIDSIGVDFMYQHSLENVKFDGFVIAQQNPVLNFDALLPFKVDLRQAEVLLPGDKDSVSVHLRTEDFNLALFSDFVDRDIIRQLGGRLNGEVSLTGIIADLQPRGRMELTRGNMRIVPAGITITEIGSVVKFEPDRVELQQLSMRSGPGRIRANGFVEIENLTPGNIQLDIRGNQFRAANTSEYNAVIDLSANLRGTVEEPDISGSLTFLSGFVNLQNFGERAVEDVQLDDEEKPVPFEFYDAMAIEMNVNFARQFLIRNRQFLDMEIELDGDVDLVKERNRDLQMFGSLQGVRGYARPLGRNFVLDEAVVSFYGPVENPELNIITVHEPPQAVDVRIFYVIEGTVQDPQFRFDSEPQLELQDIVSYTLFGKPFYELESWEQVVAGTGSSPTVADLALDVLLDRVEMLAAQRLGIDVVQIDNTQTSSGSTTSIKTGWYLNRRTFFAILNEISGTRPKTLFLLEYLLMENLELIITQGDDSREGVDLRWKFDY